MHTHCWQNKTTQLLYLYCSFLIGFQKKIFFKDLNQNPYLTLVVVVPCGQNNPLVEKAVIWMNQFWFITTATALTTRLTHICKILSTLDKEWPNEKDKLFFVI